MYVATKKIENIRGQIQHYLLIGDPENPIIINVGAKNYEAVSALVLEEYEKSKQLKLDIQ